jgi:predicted DNA-binding protein
MTSREGIEPYLLRFPPDLKAKAEAAAKADGRTLNNWLITLIEKRIEEATTMEIRVDETVYISTANGPRPVAISKKDWGDEPYGVWSIENQVWMYVGTFDECHSFIVNNLPGPPR